MINDIFISLFLDKLNNKLNYNYNYNYHLKFKVQSCRALQQAKFKRTTC